MCFCYLLLCTYNTFVNKQYLYTKWRRPTNWLINIIFYQESFNIISDEATNMRDPFFYRWHAFIDDLFQRFKESPNVRPYSRSEVWNNKKFN